MGEVWWCGFLFGFFGGGGGGSGGRLFVFWFGGLEGFCQED